MRCGCQRRPGKIRPGADFNQAIRLIAIICLMKTYFYLGLTQKEVAKRMGITQAALSQMEAGEKRLCKATLEKLAAALGIGVEQLR